MPKKRVAGSRNGKSRKPKPVKKGKIKATRAEKIRTTTGVGVMPMCNPVSRCGLSAGGEGREAPLGTPTPAEMQEMMRKNMEQMQRRKK